MILFYIWIIYAILVGELTNRNKRIGKIPQNPCYDGTNRVHLILFFASIAFFVGMRSGYGDTPTYISSYKFSRLGIVDVILNWGDLKDPLWTLYMVIVKLIAKKQYNIWLLSIAVISVVPFSKIIARKSDDVSFSMFLFSIMGFITSWMMNGMRQFVAVAILFIAVHRYIDNIGRLPRKKNIIRYLVIVLILYFVHNATIIMAIPMLIVLELEPWEKKMRWVIFAVILFCVALRFSESLFPRIMESMDYDMNNISDDNGGSLARVVIWGFPAILSFVFKKSLASKNDKYINAWINLSTLGMMITLVSTFSSGILVGRLPVFCYVYNLLLIPALLENIAADRTTKIAVRISLIIIFLFYFYITFASGGGTKYISENLHLRLH